MNGINDYLILKFILQKLYFPFEKNAIDFMFNEKQFFLNYLTNDFITKMIKKRWNCNYYFDLNLFASSSSFNYLSNNLKLAYDSKYNIKNKIISENFSNNDSTINESQITTIFSKSEKNSFNVFKYKNFYNINKIKKN